MSITCMIVDDEPNAVNLLELLIGQVTDWKIVGRYYDGLEALPALKSQKPHVVFLDINMPLLNGMELATLMPAATRIVFTTAYSEHAAESYRYQTIDYLLKPVTLKRFLLTTEKIEQYFQLNPKIQAESNLPESYFVKCGRTLRRIRLHDILYFEGNKEYVRLVTAKEKLLIYKRIKEIEEQLGHPFIRVHNSYIINMQQIEKLEVNQAFIGGMQIPVSEKYRDDFLALIGKHLF